LLDIGTSKVVAMVGEYAPGEPDRGHRHRQPTELARPQARRGGGHRVHRAVDPARGGGGRADGGCEIRSVYAGISGSHVRSLNSHGIVAIRDGK
jgi:cell division protein FtsA